MKDSILIALLSLTSMALAAEVYIIQSVLFENKCLRPRADSTWEIDLVDCDRNDNSQRATCQEYTTEGNTKYSYYKFNGKCLSNAGNGMEDGVPVIFWDCWGAANQRWTEIKRDGHIGYQLKLEEQGKCLTASGSNGKLIEQKTCNSNDMRQAWYINYMRVD